MQAAVAPTTGIQRGRGGFLRSADDAPYVSDPSGTLVKSGERKGLPCRLKYGSFSKTGTLIENDVGLTKYKQRNTLLGIGMSVELVEACRDLVGMEAGGDEFRKAADTIVVEADKLTRSSLAADRGTHGHLICERVDRDETITEADIAAGQALGLDRRTMLGVIDAWGNMLATNGLEILAIEASCVDDRWKLAGTLDRIVRCTRELRFAMPDGVIVIIPAGTVLILDIKFGKCRLAHAIQVAGYRQSVPYDTESETRGEWPWEISADHALIAHGDFGGDGGPPSIGLVWVDLAAGTHHGGECVAQAKAWAARDDLFSVAQLAVDVGEVAPPARGQEPTSPTAGEGDAGTSSLAPSPAPSQGADLSDPEYELLWAKIRHEHDALPTQQREWVNRLSTQARQSAVTFHTREVQTERSYHLCKALVTLAAGGADDEIVEVLLDYIPVECLKFKNVGHRVGSLNCEQAERLAVLSDEWATQPVPA